MKKVLIISTITLFSKCLMFAQNLPQCMVAVYQDDKNQKKSERLSLHIVAEDEAMNQVNLDNQNNVRIDRVRLYIIKKGMDHLICDLWSNQLVKDFSPIYIYYKKSLKKFNKGFKIKISYNSFKESHTYITSSPDMNFIKASQWQWLRTNIHDF